MNIKTTLAMIAASGIIFTGCAGGLVTPNAPAAPVTVTDTVARTFTNIDADAAAQIAACNRALDSAAKVIGWLSDGMSISADAIKHAATGDADGLNADSAKVEANTAKVVAETNAKVKADMQLCRRGQ